MTFDNCSTVFVTYSMAEMKWMSMSYKRRSKDKETVYVEIKG
jgi:hypothetical protein